MTMEMDRLPAFNRSAGSNAKGVFQPDGYHISGISKEELIKETLRYQ
jgi:hypothetical protein